MNTIIEILPLILFLVAYKLKGIYIATGVLMICTILQSVYLYFKNKKLTPMQIATLVMVLLFGSFTLFLKNPIFIKFKPTALYWIIAIALEISWRTYKTNLSKKVLEPMLSSADIIITNESIWKKTHHFCAAFFWALGLINLVVAYRYDLDTWVNLKVYGLPIISLAGMLSLIFWLYKNNEKQDGKGEKIE